MKLAILALLTLLLTACGGSEDDKSSGSVIEDGGNTVIEEPSTEEPSVEEPSIEEPTTELPVIPGDCVISAVASSEDGENVAANVLDSDTTTRWSGQGLGETLRIDLCAYTTMNAVNIALHKGDTRNSTFLIQVSNNDIDWSDALAKTTSSGDSDEIETYDFSKITARYIRYVGYGNTDSSSEWNSVTVFSAVECSGDDCEAVDIVVPDEPDPVEPATPVIPSDDCESEGKMFYNDGCVEWSDVYEAEHGDVGEDDHIISLSPIEMTFDALAAKVVTPNGNGWRHELKIINSSDYRVGMTEVYELFKATIKVELTDGSKTIVAQHHAANTDTITKLYIADLDESGFDAAPDGSESDSQELNGIFDVYIRLAKADGSGETKHLLTKIRSGESFDFEEENDHGVITVKINGQALASISVDDSSESYFKFGNYHQAQNPETGDKLASGNADDDYDAFYAEYFSTSKITFTNLSYIRILD